MTIPNFENTSGNNMGYKWPLSAIMMKVVIYDYIYSSITEVGLGHNSHVVDKNRTITYLA